MIENIPTQHAWLRLLAEQSTAILALGIVGSILLRDRAVRAHRLLLLALVAALAVPGLTTLVKQHQWGLLEAHPTAVRIQKAPFEILSSPTASVSTPQVETRETVTSASAGPALESTSAAWSIRWPEIVLSIWMALSTALLIRLGIRFLLGYRLTKWSELFEAEDITEAIQRAKMKLGIRIDVHCRQSDSTHSPVIWCWGPPVLLVPKTVTGLDKIDWPSVVCHELAHWKRRDHLSGLWAELIVCLLPWNPFAWVAQRRLVSLAEEACDDWVIASGQLGTRYARTLLGLTPQGHAALIPAVVSSRKGLAVRVRRILTDRCGNPQSGLRWSLAVTSLIACLAIGIALAQAGPTQSTGMIRTELTHGAVVEQLASAGTIKGTVQDPNGQPTPDYSTRISALPMTCYGVTSDEDGRFEIPWSPSWIDADQPLYLVARDYAQPLACIVEVESPSEPITIGLKPAASIQGQVLDSNDRPIPKAAAMLSLPIQFKYWAPIAGVETNENGEFKIKTIPIGHAYTMEIRAEGYETKLVKVTIPAESAKTISIDPVLLKSQSSEQVAIPVPGPNAESFKTFGVVHSLNHDEVVKLIKLPYMGHRQYEIMNKTRGTNGLLDLPYITHPYQWDGQLEDGCWFCHDTGRIRLQLVLNTFLGVPSYEFELSEEMKYKHVARGDWIVRKDATTGQKIKALQEIIHAELHRPIHFEKRQVERKVIVVTGRYALTPLPGKDPNRLYIAAKQDEETWNDEAESLSELLAKLADGITIAIDDRTEPVDTGTILYSSNGEYFTRAFHGDGPLDTEKTLPLLLDNLAKQTGLKLTVKKRLVDVWFATEEE